MDEDLKSITDGGLGSTLFVLATETLKILDEINEKLGQLIDANKKEGLDILDLDIARQSSYWDTKYGKEVNISFEGLETDSNELLVARFKLNLTGYSYTLNKNLVAARIRER